MRLLFVGNDLHRKGADILIESVRRLRADTGLPEVELHLVSNAPVEPEPGVMVHRGLTANSPELQEQYQMADLFCLPTRGDCLPMVLAEAAATGLGLVSTDVGAISEIVRPGITGELVPPGDADALTAVLRELVLDGDTRRRYGVAARALAEREHDACANSARLAGLMTEVACDGRRA